MAGALMGMGFHTRPSAGWHGHTINKEEATFLPKLNFVDPAPMGRELWSVFIASFIDIVAITWFIQEN